MFLQIVIWISTLTLFIILRSICLPLFDQTCPYCFLGMMWNRNTFLSVYSETAMFPIDLVSSSLFPTFVLLFCTTWWKRLTALTTLLWSECCELRNRYIRPGKARRHQLCNMMMIGLIVHVDEEEPSEEGVGTKWNILFFTLPSGKSTTNLVQLRNNCMYALISVEKEKKEKWETLSIKGETVDPYLHNSAMDAICGAGGAPQAENDY